MKFYFFCIFRFYNLFYEITKFQNFKNSKKFKNLREKKIQKLEKKKFKNLREKKFKNLRKKNSKT